MIDANNGFNEINRKAMLWTVRHLWPTGSRFAFNCYRHSGQLILRRGRADGSCYVLHSSEGVTQGDPLGMVLYGLAVTPLTKHLRTTVPDLLIPAYADDLAMAGPAQAIGTAMTELQSVGPLRGYYPEPVRAFSSAM